MRGMYRCCVLIGIFFSVFPSAFSDESLPTGNAADGEKIFYRMCLYCHTSDEKSKFGPSLLWIGERRSTAWLHDWLENPSEMIEHDEYAQILRENNEYELTMPTLPDMQDAQKRADVIAYLLSAF